MLGNSGEAYTCCRSMRHASEGARSRASTFQCRHEEHGVSTTLPCLGDRARDLLIPVPIAWRSAQPRDYCNRCGGPNYLRTHIRIKTAETGPQIWRFNRIDEKCGRDEADDSLGSWLTIRAVTHVTPTVHDDRCERLTDTLGHITTFGFCACDLRICGSPCLDHTLGTAKTPCTAAVLRINGILDQTHSPTR